MSATGLGRRAFLRGCAAGTVLAYGAAAWAETAQIALKIDRVEQRHPLMPAIQKAFESLQKLDEVKDYTALFVKEEKLGRGLAKAQMELKLREQPYSLYLKFVTPSAGREVVYVQGRNNNFLQAHDVGFRGLAGTMSLDPQGKLAMDGNRHPATMLGMRKLVTGVIDQWLNETTIAGATVNMFPNTRLGNLSTTLIEVAYTQPVKGATYQMTRLYVDHENTYPIRLQNYEFGKREGVLAEDYFYSNLKVNVGLQDVDFDVRNPKYGF